MKVLSILRVLPFTALALASIWAANRAPDGRRPPQMDFAVTPEAIANALTKVPHIASMGMLFVLAVLATGYSRVWLAAMLTFLVGVGWELVQTTVIGHNPRIVDIFPNLVGIAVAWIIVSMSVFLWRSARSRLSRNSYRPSQNSFDDS
jgi:VanZ family protein